MSSVHLLVFAVQFKKELPTHLLSAKYFITLGGKTLIHFGRPSLASIPGTTKASAYRILGGPGSDATDPPSLNLALP